MSRVRTTAEFEAPTLDVVKYRNVIDQYMIQGQVEGVTKWLDAVLEHTPKYTGTAQGTYAPLGRVVNRAVFNHSNRTGKEYFVYKGRKYRLGFDAAAQYQHHVLKSQASASRLIYTFEFHPKLPYVLWNEVLKAPPWLNLAGPTPWNALKAGLSAYKRFAEGALVQNFPSVIKSIGMIKLRTKNG
jgi:hypothetical protein